MCGKQSGFPVTMTRTPVVWVAAHYSLRIWSGTRVPAALYRLAAPQISVHHMVCARLNLGVNPKSSSAELEEDHTVYPGIACFSP